MEEQNEQNREEQENTPGMSAKEDASGREKIPETGGPEENGKKTDLSESIKASPLQAELDHLANELMKVRAEVAKIVIGQNDALTQMLAGLLTGGHLLIEGVPGIAKTLMARLLAKTVDVGFSRIQFTPDLMPSDVIGTNVFNVKESEFDFKRGPIFSNIVLIDEINRAPAKTQSSLFEVMQEKQISVDGVTYPMTFPFMVLATQNPIEQEGTYKLPEAQLDRFLFKVKMGYPSLEEEEAILMRFRTGVAEEELDKIRRIIDVSTIKKMRQTVEKVHIEEPLLKYVASLIHETRNHPGIYLGASPRASLAILRTSKAMAAMAGRDFVTPEDIKRVLGPVLNHRIILTPDREMEGFEVEDIIAEITEQIEVPR